MKKIIRCPTIAGDGDIVTVDADGEEIYLDIAIDGESFSAAIDGLITKAIETARATLAKAGLTAGDISKIIFIGEPVKLQCPKNFSPPTAPQQKYVLPSSWSRSATVTRLKFRRLTAVGIRVSLR